MVDLNFEGANILVEQTSKILDPDMDFSPIFSS